MRGVLERKAGPKWGCGWSLQLRLYWLNRGLLDLGHRLAVEALAHSDAQQRTVSRCQALHIAGQFSFFMGRYEEAKGHLLESLAIARELGDKGRISTELALLGVTYLGQEDLATARTHLEEALAWARDLGESVRIASSLNALAELHRTEGKLGSAESLYRESLAIRRELKDRDGIAIDLLNLSVVSLGLGMRDRARATLLEAALISAEIGSKRLSQAVLDAAAGLAAALQEHERAARLYGASEAQMKLVGLHREPADEAFLAPLMTTVRDALGVAGFAAASAAGAALPAESAIAEVHAWLQHALLIRVGRSEAQCRSNREPRQGEHGAAGVPVLASAPDVSCAESAAGGVRRKGGVWRYVAKRRCRRSGPICPLASAPPNSSKCCLAVVNRSRASLRDVVELRAQIIACTPNKLAGSNPALAASPSGRV